MILSMTGYGKTTVDLPGKKFNIEIKSLNSKGTDISVKLPLVFRDKEMEIRTLLSQQLQRGKIDFYMSSEDNSETPNFRINKELAKKYYAELKELTSELGEENTEMLLPVLLKLPDVFQADKPENEDEGWQAVRDGIVQTISLVTICRLNEGTILGNDILLRVGKILELLDSIEPLESNRLNDIRNRLKTGLQQLGRPDVPPIVPDENRFEQELIFYLERLDITEEKVRLKKHCDYFLNTLDDQESQGKKLGFITQEMGREINTIGSKANEAGIQKIVVQMKDELEKVKEQLGNIL